jgi:hypothetical protein
VTSGVSTVISRSVVSPTSDPDGGGASGAGTAAGDAAGVLVALLVGAGACAAWVAEVAGFGAGLEKNAW